MILEGIITTTSPEGHVNIAPMGPEVEDGMQRLVLKPFNTSRTLRNLRNRRRGVFHVVDDVELLARSAVDPDAQADVIRPDGCAEDLWVLADACRWYAFEVDTWDDRHERHRLECRVLTEGMLRPFFGFNRAKHAVLEAAILATRVHLLPAEEIARQFCHLETLVEKTGGRQEQRAFEFLRQYVHNNGVSATSRK